MFSSVLVKNSEGYGLHCCCMAVPGVDRQEPRARLPQGLLKLGAQGMRGRETQAGPDVMRKGGRALVHCASAFQYGSTSVLSAGNQPAPTSPLLLHASELSRPSLTSPYASNLCPAGRRRPNCPIVTHTPIRYFLIYVSFLFLTSLRSIFSLSLAFPLFTRMSVHLPLFSTSPSIQMPIFPSHYSPDAGLPVPLCFWLSL